MTGYGAFGFSFRPSYFDRWVGGPSLKLWLDRGGMLAVPVMRGGGERDVHNNKYVPEARGYVKVIPS